MNKIDPKSPGKSTAGDDFCDPHGHLGSMSNSGHENLSRAGNGSFSSLPQGGDSPDGDAYVAKYRSRGRSPAPAEPSGANLNDEGDGYDDSDVGTGGGYTVNENVVKRR